MKNQKTKNTSKSLEAKANILTKENVSDGRSFNDNLGLLLILILGSIIYSNSFNGTFHFDDLERIPNNMALRDLTNLQAIWNYGQMRFVAYYTFAINYHFGGVNTWGYHLFNLLIHLTTSLLVYYFTVLICSTAQLRDSSFAKAKYTIAFITSILFVAHPLATQSVCYIVQRMASLVALFYLLSLSFYLKARLLNPNNNSKYLLFLLSALSAGLAFLTKENSFTIPFTILLMEIFFLSEKNFKVNLKHPKVIGILGISIIFIVIVMNVYSASIFKSIPPDDHNGFREVTSMNYLFTQFPVILKYIQLLILPVGLNLDYDFPIYNSLLSIASVGSLLVLLALVYLAFYLFNRNRIISFGIFWFFLTLLVESSIIPISDVIFEHRTYLPSFGFFIIIASLSYNRLFLKNTTYGILFLTILVGTYSILTYSRNKVWKNDYTLWSDVIIKSPNKARGYNNRGMYLRETDRYEEMLKDFNKAIELEPKFTDAYNNRGNVYVKQQNYQESLTNFNKAVELNPNDPDSHNNRGTANMGLKSYAAAIADFDKAIELRPEYTMAFANRGITYLNMGNKDQGCKDLKKSIDNGFEPTKSIFDQYCNDVKNIK